MENAIENNEIIPESKAARWAWRVSLIPLLGVPLYAVLAFIALYRIGNKGRTGFWLLRRGVIASFINAIVIVGYYFCPQYEGDSFSDRNPYHGYIMRKLDGSWKHIGTWYYWDFHKHVDKIAGVYDFYGNKQGVWIEVRRMGSYYKGEYINGKREGKWTYFVENGTKYWEKNYINGKLEGEMISWHKNRNIERRAFFKNDKWAGTWQYWNESGQLIKEENYDNGKLISTKEYPTPQPSPSPAPEGKSK